MPGFELDTIHLPIVSFLEISLQLSKKKKYLKERKQRTKYPRIPKKQALVLWPGIRPEPLRWESRVQDIGPPETSQPHVISNGESSPRDLHLNAKTQLHSTTSKLQCCTPHAKQLARREHKPIH